MRANPDMTFLVSYDCPYCQSALMGRTARSDAWVRCPSCGRASEPPEHAVTLAPPAPGEDVLVIGPDPDPRPMTPVAVADYRDARPARHPVSPLRVACSAALFVSVSMLLFAVLDGSTMGTAFFGAAAVVCIALLAVPARS
jgi:predicted RNA-binding Zn-ribbon protein involved in translation (DUF1610 family)